MKHQPHVTFTAQALAFRALMNMYDVFKSKETDDPFDYLPLIVFSAFSIEAYINSVGSRKISFWEELERLPWRSKVEILHSNLRKKADWGKDPLQFASQVFGIRDRIAHGKPETISGPICDDYQTAISMAYVQHIKPSIFDKLDRDWILDSAERLYSLLEYIGALYGLHEDDFASFSEAVMQRHGDPTDDG
jgi:hypothetical protein